MSEVSPASSAASLKRHAWSPSELKSILEAERAGTPFITFHAPDGEHQVVRLEVGQARGLVLGRGPEADVDLDGDTLVSRTHCVIRKVGSNWMVEDAGLSRNGTFLDDARVTGSAQLADRSVLTLGSTHILFRSPAPSGALTTVIGLRSDKPAPELSGAQRKVLEELARPCIQSGNFTSPATNQEIAEALFLSIETVKTHIKALFRLFDLDDEPRSSKRLALVERAIASGTLDLRAGGQGGDQGVG